MSFYQWEWVQELNGKNLLKGNIRTCSYSLKTFESADTSIITENAFYNDKGRLTSSMRTTSGRFGVFQNSTLRIYDESDTTCILQYHIQDKDTASVYKFEYDSFGRMLKASLFNWGKYYSSFNFKYNSESLKSECLVLFAVKNDSNITKYEYDSNRNLLVVAEYDGSEFQKSMERNYNKDGYLVGLKYTLHSNLESSYTEKHTIDEFGNIIESLRTDFNGLFQSHQKYTYNDKGLMESQTLLDAYGDTIVHFSMKYTYDDHDNWISCFTTANDTLIQIEEWQIEYFENNR